MSKECKIFHELVCSMKRYRFPFDESSIPQDGIYFLFEKGEIGHGAERIVRIGTHTGEGQLPSRLWQHFLNENKDRSIFRKNIGRVSFFSCIPPPGFQGHSPRCSILSSIF